MGTDKKPDKKRKCAKKKEKRETLRITADEYAKRVFKYKKINQEKREKMREEIIPKCINKIIKKINEEYEESIKEGENVVCILEYSSFGENFKTLKTKYDDKKLLYKGIANSKELRQFNIIFNDKKEIINVAVDHISYLYVKGEKDED